MVLWKRPIYLVIAARFICEILALNLFVGNIDIRWHNGDRRTGPSGERGMLTDAI
jgi:hypothetical protein